MYKQQIQQINGQLSHTNKAIISLGCSFVQGQGAVNDDLYIKYKWLYSELGRPLRIQLNNDAKHDLIKEYPNIILGPDGEIDFTFMEYDNSFVNVLCHKYFDRSYVPINLGIRGCGNRATIKELYFRPEIDWHKIQEIIVIYCPSSLERFDFVNDQWHEHFHWTCMWPHYSNKEPSASQKLWEGYGRTIYSEKQGVIEQLSNIQELLSWCKNKNAKLVITPGFDRRINKEVFEQYLNMKVTRDNSREFISEYDNTKIGEDSANLINLWPWDLMFKPSGQETFAHLSMAQEQGIDMTDHFFQFLGKGSPTMWMTPCGHPSAKAHDLFAKLLHSYIIENLL